MRYKNAADILPSALLREVQRYIEGEVIYIPKLKSRREWGAVSGSKGFYLERNSRIRALFREGRPVGELAAEYGLSASSIKKIIYSEK